jgi:polypeptide N-acetylgalactosaminyltransferase
MEMTKIDYVSRNLKRVAEVWLDDYKKFLYQGNPTRYAKADVGDLTKQFEMKANMNCKPFDYFLERVAPDMIMYFPIVPTYFASGNIETEYKNPKGISKCLSIYASSYAEPIKLVDCGDKAAKVAFTLEKSIRYNDTNDQCLSSNQLGFTNCNHQGWDQYWKFDFHSRQIISMDKKKCLQANVINTNITLETCDEKITFQRWKWTIENSTALENFDKTGIIYQK